VRTFHPASHTELDSSGEGIAFARKAQVARVGNGCCAGEGISCTPISAGRLFAGLPGTPLYSELQRGRISYRMYCFIKE
jgi:hypothetical protein